MEKPIITTDLGFARSICQDAALYFKPCDAGAAASQIERLMGDSELQERLCRKGKKRLAAFDTPAERARKILEICNGLVVEPNRAFAVERSP